MAYDAESRRDLRDLLTDRIDISDEIAVEFPLSLYARHQGNHAKEHLFFGKFCTPNRLMDITGGAVTGGNGTTEIALNDFVCIAPPEAGSNFERLGPPVYFVATPRSRTPVTTTFEVIMDSNQDISIRIFTWDPAGNPQGGVRVDWRCCVVSQDVIG